VRISVISISLAIVVNLITIAIVTGFQNEVRRKITGFNAPLFISKAGTTTLYECEPIHKNQTAIEPLKLIEGISSIVPVCYKPALLQSNKFQDTLQLSSGSDSIVQKQEISGVVMKGVNEEYDWTFINSHLVSGRLPNVNGKSVSTEILISSRIATNLNYHLNDDAAAFYVKDQPVMKRYKVVGIYNTGLEEYDKKMIFCDIREVQKMSDFGVSSEIIIEDTLTKSGAITVKANISGKAKDLTFDWGKGPDIYSGFYLNELKDTTIRLIVSQMDYARNVSTPLDTSYLKIKYKGVIKTLDLKKDSFQELIRDETAENSYNLTADNTKIHVTTLSGNGDFSNYIAGYEVQVNDWNQLEEIKSELKNKVEMLPTKDGELLQIQSILDTESDLFAWLSFLDYNVIIIICLMLLIGIINVGSAMLVLIVVRTNFIGILKAMGTTNWSIRKVFLYQAAYLILKGLIYGNLIGLTLCWVQIQFGVLSLDATVYYLDKVPVELTFLNWFFINFITFFVCLVSLIIPSYVVTRINPVKAIRFN
jgi:lipoprotein-releasing system permease protein